MSPLNWPRNRLLLALPAGNLKRLMSQLEPIPCERGQVLLDADSALDDVFFPDSGVVSVVAVYEDGALSRWRRSAGRAARGSKPSSATKSLQYGVSCKSQEAPRGFRAARS